MKYVQLASLSTPAAVSAWFQDELVNRGVDASYTYYVLSLLRGEPEEVGHSYELYSSRTRPDSYQRLRAKKCAVECLKSAADTNEGFEALVEELLVRLQNPNTRILTQLSEEPYLGNSEDSEGALIDFSNNESGLSRSEPKTFAERAKLYYDAFPALEVDLELTRKDNNNQVCESPLSGRVEAARARCRKRKERNTKRTTKNRTAVIFGEPKGRRIPSPGNSGNQEFSTDKLRKLQHQTSEVSARRMGSVCHDDSLITNLARKFDSKLAAIWADVPSVGESTWFSVNRKEDASEKVYDSLILSIPETFANLGSNVHGRHSKFGFATLPTRTYISSDNLQSFRGDKQEDGNEQTECGTSNDSHSKVIPHLCLKNSTLRYDREKTAFSEVVPGRRFASCNDRCPTSPSKDLQRSNLNCGESSENLLISSRTHFTPIRVDLEERPLSSSSIELASYNIPPVPRQGSGDDENILRENCSTKSNDSKTKDANGESGDSQGGTPFTEPLAILGDLPKIPSESVILKRTLNDESIRALWKRSENDFGKPTIDEDILGVAHCWNDAAITYREASKELRQEISDEEDELLKHISKIQEGFASGIDYYGESDTLDDLFPAETIPDCSYERTTLQEEVVASNSLEYLSHFSVVDQRSEQDTNGCFFATPELYDSAIVTSVRSIQDLQRRKKQLQKPCTFFMEGICRRTDCKFSHDLSAITCRFWEEGNCFKGLACPFLHGYAPSADRESSEDDEATTIKACFPIDKKKKDIKRACDNFRIESEHDFPSLVGHYPSNRNIVKNMGKKSTIKASKVLGGLNIFTKKAAGKRKKKKHVTSTPGSQEYISSSTPNAETKKKLTDIAKKSRESITAVLREELHLT